MNASKILFEIFSLLLLALSAYFSVKMLNNIRKRNWLPAYDGAYPVFIITMSNSFFSLCASSHFKTPFIVLSIVALVFSLLIVFMQHLVNNYPDWGGGTKDEIHFNCFKASLACGVISQLIVIFCLCAYFNKTMIEIAIFLYLTVSLIVCLAKNRQIKNNRLAIIKSIRAINQ